MTKAAQLSSRDESILVQSAFRNKLINGDFNIWQRGSSKVVGAGQELFSADRFLAASGAGGALNITRAELDQDVIFAGSSPVSALVLNVTTAPSSGIRFEQRIEDVRTLAGRTATFSAYLKNLSGASQTYLFNINQNFGGGGSAGVQAAGVVSVTLAAGEAKYFEGTFVVPSVAGKIIGTNSYLTIGLSLANNVTGSFVTTMWQLEHGRVRTPFEFRPISVELPLCQRYYEKSFALNVAPGSGTGVGNVLTTGTQILGASTSQSGPTIYFKNTKRGIGVLPTVTIYNPATAGSNQIQNSNLGVACTASTVSSRSPSGFTVNYTSPASSAVGHIIAFEWDADAEI